MTIHIEIDNEYLVVSNPVSPKKKKGLLVRDRTEKFVKSMSADVE